MRYTNTLIVICVAGLLLLAGCGGNATPPAPEPSTEASVTDVQADLNNIDSLDQDLNLSDLDSLDKDLNLG